MAVADLPGLKAAVKTLLDGANTTTGSPIDLSQSLADRVKQVLQINVEKMPIQPSFFPYVTMFYESKQIELSDTAARQLNGRRTGLAELKIVGCVWIDDMNTANYDIKDLADNECELLMENVEQVLRSDPTMAGKCLSSHPTAVTYHNFRNQEGAHLRAGIMNLRVRFFY